MSTFDIEKSGVVSEWLAACGWIKSGKEECPWRHTEVDDGLFTQGAAALVTMQTQRNALSELEHS